MLPRTHHHQILTALNQCRSMKQLNQIHAQVIITSDGTPNDHDNYNIFSKLLLFSATSDTPDLTYTHKLFSSIPTPTTFVWTTIIRACSRGQNPNRALTHFVDMLRSGVRPDHLTFPFLAKSSARLASVSAGLSIHCCVVKAGLDVDRFVRNSLIHMYASCSEIWYARKLFDGMTNPNLVSWNSMVDGYAKCGDMMSARKLFDAMQDRDVVSWSALIDGYVKSSEHDEALAVFERMLVDGPRANTVTMVSILSACAHLGALDKGRTMHQYIAANGLEMTLLLATSIVDMYSKCGAIDEALKAFHSVPVSDTDVLIWNTMIGGLATHGFCQESLDLYKQMEEVKIIPDEITYLSLLSACAHAGRVDDAWTLFKSIQAKGTMAPHIEHYACMVDVLGRSGRVKEALEFVQDMPIEPSASVLGALLNGCHVHGRLDIGEEVAKKLVELEPNADGRYVGLANIYASSRRWNEARVARKVMEERGVKKVPGCSSVEVEGILYGFSAHDRFHPKSAEIYAVLTIIVDQMRNDSDDWVLNPYDLCDLTSGF